MNGVFNSASSEFQNVCSGKFYVENARASSYINLELHIRACLEESLVLFCLEENSYQTLRVIEYYIIYT